MAHRSTFPHHSLLLSILALAVVTLCTSLAFSADTYAITQTTEVSLAWDPNDPIPDGYRIYQRVD